MLLGSSYNISTGLGFSWTFHSILLITLYEELNTQIIINNMQLWCLQSFIKSYKSVHKIFLKRCSFSKDSASNLPNGGFSGIFRKAQKKPHLDIFSLKSLGKSQSSEFSKD